MTTGKQTLKQMEYHTSFNYQQSMR